MQYAEREDFKEIAWDLINAAKTAETRVEGFLMLIETHFHRNPEAPDFPTYAGHWLAASEGEIDSDTFSILLARFPLPTNRKIADGYSDWGSYGDPQYK